MEYVSFVSEALVLVPLVPKVEIMDEELPKKNVGETLILAEETSVIRGKSAREGTCMGSSRWS